MGLKNYTYNVDKSGVVYLKTLGETLNGAIISDINQLLLAVAQDNENIKVLIVDLLSIKNVHPNMEMIKMDSRWIIRGYDMSIVISDHPMMSNIGQVLTSFMAMTFERFIKGKKFHIVSTLEEAQELLASRDSELSLPKLSNS